jgi:hypothetical protein
MLRRGCWSRIRLESLPSATPMTSFFVLASRGSLRRSGRTEIRTCGSCRARKIGLLGRRLRRVAIPRRRRRGRLCGLSTIRRVTGRRERLPVGAIHGRRHSDAAPNCVSRHKGLRLCGHWGKDAILIEPYAVSAAAIVGVLEAGAANLYALVGLKGFIYCMSQVGSYLSPTAIATGNGSALAWS